MYGGGHGVPRNYAEAANWQNYILAHMWLNLAGAQGDAGFSLTAITWPE